MNSIRGTFSPILLFLTWDPLARQPTNLLKEVSKN